MTQPIPEGFHSVTPCIAVDGGVEALEFYERAFGATVRLRLVVGGKLMHSELLIGNSIVCVNDAFPDYGTTAPEKDALASCSLMIYCEDAAALQDRAVAAGATLINAVTDQFHGDRAGSIRDPFGHRWLLATHTEDLSEEELQRRTDEMMSSST